MSDEEVGKLWRRCVIQADAIADFHDFIRVRIPEIGHFVKEEELLRMVLRLIRKLVEERVRNLRLQIRAEDCGSPTHNFLVDQRTVDRSVNEEKLAKRQFGIPEEA